MIEQQGRVVELRANRARVSLGAASGCPACDAGRGCGAGIFGKLVRRKDLSLILDNHLQPGHLQPGHLQPGHLQLEPGQSVIVGIPESFFLGLLARLYLIPLLAALCGAAFGHYLGYRFSLSGFSHDFLALIGALFFAALTLLINWKGKNQPAVEQRVQLLRCPDSQAGQQCQKALKL
jgi:positive regulator of sigma E activity